MKNVHEPQRRLAAGWPYPVPPRFRGASLLTAAIIASAALVNGCISTHETVREEPERLKVEFENDRAARLFYEALDRMPEAHGRRESETKFEIPVVLSVSRKVVLSENAAFNKAVRQCDTNQDGKITEQEARIFAEQQSH